MNFKVYILATATVIVGLVELIVGGILPVIADDLQISIGTAGQLITVFALVFAISGPVLLSLTAKVERKKLYLISLGGFFLGNILTFLSTDFSFVMIARVITAMSASLVIVLSLTIAGRIVSPEYRGKAIGIISMGISSSLVLGVPIGILVTNWFGWQTVFLGIGLLTIIPFILISFYVDRIKPEQVQPLLSQIKALGNFKIIGAHLAVAFMLAGHYTFYAYFTPFLENNLHLSGYWISVFYFLFGVAAVSGGGIGGVLADRIGATKSMLIFISTFSVVLFVLPYTTFFMPLFIIVMMIWGALSWSNSPATQSYLIQTDPDNSDIHQSLHNSAIQMGIALGSGIGGIVIENQGTAAHTATVGGFVVIIAFICAVISIVLPNRKHARNTSHLPKKV